MRKFQVAAAELEKERVELQGGDDGYQIPAEKSVIKFFTRFILLLELLWIQMIKVPQVELFRVVGEVYCIDILN